MVVEVVRRHGGAAEPSPTESLCDSASSPVKITGEALEGARRCDAADISGAIVEAAVRAIFGVRNWGVEGVRSRGPIFRTGVGCR